GGDKWGPAAGRGSGDGDHRGGWTDQDVSCFSEEGGVARRPPRPLQARVPGGAGRRRRLVHDRARGNGRVPRPQWGGEDDGREDAVGPDLPDQRDGPGARLRSLAAGGCLSAPVLPRDGAEESALVGPSRG